MSSPSSASKTAGQTLEQRRADHAWNAIVRIKMKGDSEAKAYGREARKLPVRIMTAGLGPALAFLRAKAREKKISLQDLLNNVSDWVVGEHGRGIKPTAPVKAQGSPPINCPILQHIIKGDALFLRRATDEALAYLVWLVRFAEAEGLTQDDDDTGSDTSASPGGMAGPAEEAR